MFQEVRQKGAMALLGSPGWLWLAAFLLTVFSVEEKGMLQPDQEEESATAKTQLAQPSGDARETATLSEEPTWPTT